MRVDTFTEANQLYQKYANTEINQERKDNHQLTKFLLLPSEKRINWMFRSIESEKKTVARGIEIRPIQSENKKLC